jgi:hypothetical protein
MLGLTVPPMLLARTDEVIRQPVGIEHRAVMVREQQAGHDVELRLPQGSSTTAGVFPFEKVIQLD